MRIGDLLRTGLVVSVCVLLEHQQRTILARGAEDCSARGCDLVPEISGMIHVTLPLDVVYHTRHSFIPLPLNNISEARCHSSAIQVTMRLDGCPECRVCAICVSADRVAEWAADSKVDEQTVTYCFTCRFCVRHLT